MRRTSTKEDLGARARWGLRPDTIPQLAALMVCVSLAVLSLVETTSRTDFLAYLDTEIQRTAEELNRRLEMTLEAERKKGSSSSSDTEAKITSDDQIGSVSEAQAQLTYKRHRLLYLLLRGTNSDEGTMKGIMGENVSRERIYLASSGVQTADYSSGEPPTSIFAGWMLFFHFAYMPSNLLVAILLVSCGAIGALTAGLRTDDFTTFKDLCLGVGTGFICYLTIRGGKDFFVANTQWTGLSLNPFSSGLAGILAGLFSERFFKFLSFVFDTITSRLQAAFQERLNGGDKDDGGREP